MAFTGTDVFALSKETLNDDGEIRYKPGPALKFVNAAMGALALMRPDLCLITTNIATVPDSAVQDVAIANVRAMKLYNIYRIVGGAGLIEANFRVMQSYSPSWQSEKSGNPINWLRDPDTDPVKGSGTRYFLSPPPKAGIQVQAQFAAAPAELTDLAQTVPFIDVYKEPMAQYVISRFQGKDDEHVNSGRAMQAMQSCLQLLGLAKEAKIVYNEGKPT